MDEEIWDCMYYLVAIANCYDIDLEKTICDNYHIGIVNIDHCGGRAQITNAVLLGNNEAAFGYARVGTDPQRNWKPLYFFDPDLCKEEE